MRGTYSMRIQAARRPRILWGSVATLFCLVLSVDANQSVPVGNLAAHWPFDSLVTPSPDVSGNGNSAFLVNTPTAVAGGGLFGGGLHFTAASAEYGYAVNS